MIHVLATVELHPGQREAFLAEFQRIVPLVRAERGCLEYGPAIDAETDIAAQQRLGENVMVVVEKWQDLESLQAHLTAPHMVEYRPKVKPLIVQSKLQILQPA